MISSAQHAQQLGSALEPPRNPSGKRHLIFYVIVLFIFLTTSEKLN